MMLLFRLVLNQIIPLLVLTVYLVTLTSSTCMTSLPCESTVEYCDVEKEECLPCQTLCQQLPYNEDCLKYCPDFKLSTEMKTAKITKSVVDVSLSLSSTLKPEVVPATVAKLFKHHTKKNEVNKSEKDGGNISKPRNKNQGVTVIKYSKEDIDSFALAFAVTGCLLVMLISISIGLLLRNRSHGNKGNNINKRKIKNKMKAHFDNAGFDKNAEETSVKIHVYDPETPVALGNCQRLSWSEKSANESPVVLDKITYM